VGVFHETAGEGGSGDDHGGGTTTTTTTTTATSLLTHFDGEKMNRIAKRIDVAAKESLGTVMDGE